MNTRQSAAFLLLFFWALVTQAQTVNIIHQDACSGTLGIYEAASDVNDNDITIWRWDFNNDSIFNDRFGKQVSFGFSSDGSFPVGLRIITVNQDTITTYQDVTVFASPLANFVASNHCEEEPIALQDASTAATGTIVDWSWEVVSQPGSGQNGQSASFTFGEAGDKSILLTVETDQGCTGFAEKIVTIHPKPVASFENDPACTNATTSFTNTSNDDAGTPSWAFWEFGDGTTSGAQNPTHTYSSEGSVTVQLIAGTQQQCYDTISQAVTVGLPPVVDIITPEDSLLYIDQSITLEVAGDGSAFNWSTGSISSSEIITEGGEYQVTVTGTNGCETVLSKTVADAIPPGPNFRSNFVTPGADGVNDFAEVEHLQAFETCQLTLYNRLGDEVFSSSDYQNDWNGSNNGELDPGAYFYVLRCDDFPEKTGTLNLLR